MDISTIAQLVTAAVVAAAGLWKAIAALVGYFKK